MDFTAYFVEACFILAVYFAYKIYSSLRVRFLVLKIITNDLKYNAAVPGWQATSFLDAIRMANKMNGNQYDAAIIFMLTQLSVMETNSETKSFKIEKYALIENIVPMSKFGGDLIEDHIRLS